MVPTRPYWAALAPLMMEKQINMNIYIYTSIYLYMYIYIYICVCVCVCLGAGGRLLLVCQSCGFLGGVEGGLPLEQTYSLPKNTRQPQPPK